MVKGKRREPVPPARMMPLRVEVEVGKLKWEVEVEARSAQLKIKGKV